MTRKGSAAKQLHWQKLLKRQASSGQSVREFCVAEGVSQPSFYAWRRRLREQNGESTRAESVSSLAASDGRPGDGQQFVPLKLVDAMPSLEILHPRGYRIQLNGDVNPVALRHVLEALDDRGRR